MTGLKPYSKGKMWCIVCEQWIDPIIESDQIYTGSHGMYHKKRFCPVRSIIPPRLRASGHGPESRQRRQAKGTYY